MAAVDIDTAGSDKDGLPVSSTDVEKYPLIVHYCGGTWSYSNVY